MSDARLDLERFAGSLGLPLEELTKRAVDAHRFGQRLLRHIARERGIDYLREVVLHAHRLDPAMAAQLRLLAPSERKIPPGMVVRGEAVELGLDVSGVVVIAVADPTDRMVRERVQRYLGSRPIRFVFQSTESIRRLAPEGESPLAEVTDAAEVQSDTTPSFRSIIDEEISPVLGATEGDTDEGISAGARTGETLLDVVFQKALQVRATDIHIDPYVKSATNEEGMLVRFRIDKVLRVAPDLSVSGRSGVRAADTIARALKMSASVDINDRTPADFRVRRNVGGKTVYARAHTHPARLGPSRGATKTTIRLLETKRWNIAGLGFNDELLGRWKRALDEGSGMLLVSGPMGSGKSSTVFASIPEIVNEEVAAYSIEDPVEFEIEGVTQYEINARDLKQRAELMTRTLHDIRRQDANIVIIGEIRDRQSMELAFDLATSGIRVVATVHAASAVHTIQKLLEWDLDPFIVATTLRCVLNMRLLQHICPKCRIPVTHDDESWWPESIFGRPLPEKGWRSSPEGCANCNNTGTIGQFPIGELLMLTSTSIATLRTPEGLASLARGFRSLEDEAVDALVEGKTSIRAVRAAQIGTASYLVSDEPSPPASVGADVKEAMS